MRQIFTVRFFAAVGALLGLLVLLTALFRSDDSVAELVEQEPMERRMELVALVFSTTSVDFAIGDDGLTTGFARPRPRPGADDADLSGHTR